MPDKDVFVEATRLEDWTHLAGNGAAARAKSVSLRRARYAGYAGATAATAAVAVGVVAIAGTFGGSGGSAVIAGKPAKTHTPAKVTSPPTSPAPTTSQPPAEGTMGALFEQWKSCPDSELTVVNTMSQDPPHLQLNWRDACHRNVATLSELLPDYQVTPGVASIVTPKDASPGDIFTPNVFDDPKFVIPAGYEPHMGTALYRVVAKDGDTTKVYIHGVNRVDGGKPPNSEAVTLPNGLQAWLALDAKLADGQPGCEIYILDKGHTFYMLTAAQPNFDFKKLVTSPQFADMAAKALAEPES